MYVVKLHYRIAPHHIALLLISQASKATFLSTEFE